MSESQRRSGNDSGEQFGRSQRKLLSDWDLGRQDADVLSRHVQMISESLAACAATPRHRRPSAGDLDGLGKASVETIFPAWRRTCPEKTGVAEEERTTWAEGSEERGWASEGSRGGLVAWSPGAARPSRVDMYAPDEVDPRRMIDVIRRELQALSEMAPGVAQIATALADTIRHYQDCRRCNDKICSSLPWILNRIQKLIKYVTTKRQKSYVWPNDHSYLRLSRPKFSAKEVEEEKKRSSESESAWVSASASGREVLLGKQEEVDVRTISDAVPGVQLLLEVKPEKTRKRFFDKAKSKVVGDSAERRRFPTLHLRDRSSAPVVQVLRPRPPPRLVCQKKQEVVSPKEFAYAVRLPIASRPQVAALAPVAYSVGRRSEVRSATPAFYPRAVAPCERYSLQPKRNPVTVLERRNVRADPEAIPLERRSRDGFPLTSESFLPEARELLPEEEEEKMHLEKVRELEEEVKGLKELMLEVHQNQMELSKVLLEKGVYCQPMIKLTDPAMLEEESEAVRKAAKLEALAARSSSVESLQTTVDDLKRKCTVKNRMIVTLLKGLRSDVPKEWWEDLVDYIFDEAKPIEEFDPEKVSEFIRQTSLFLLSGEKGASAEPPAPRRDRLPSEEEPKMRGIAGAEAWRDLQFLSCCESLKAKEPDDVLGFLSPVAVMAFPAVDDTDTTIRKLENQISLLNTENDRLWHQVHELRELLKSSIGQMSERATVGPRPSAKLPAKTINLTIQIGDKESRLRKGKPAVKILRADEEPRAAPSDGPPAVKSTSSESPAEEEAEAPRSDLPSALEGKLPPRSKSSRRRSENDLNYLDEATPPIPGYKREKEKLRALLREPSGRPPLAATPHPSAQDLFRPVVWVPSRYLIPEAGPSRKPHLECILQKPSLMELAEKRNPGTFATMTNERELQTIPENEGAEAEPWTRASEDVTRAIDRLRTRVRSMHKDVSVLKSKNDRIDKLLDKLVDDAADNRDEFAEIESSFSDLRDRMG